MDRRGMGGETCTVQRFVYTTARKTNISLDRSVRPPRNEPGQRRSYRRAWVVQLILYLAAQKTNVSLHRADPPPLDPLPPGEGK